MNLITSAGRLVVGIGTLLINSTQPPGASYSDPSIVAGRRWAPWPATPASASPERRLIDDEGTLYAPTSLSLEGSAAIEDACLITYSVEEEGTFLSLGDTNANLNLLFTDQALLNLTKVAQQASRKMLRARDHPVPDWLGHELH